MTSTTAAQSGEAELAQALDRLHDVRGSGDGWTARCPAHDDSHASLSIGRPSPPSRA